MSNESYFVIEDYGLGGKPAVTIKCDQSLLEGVVDNAKRNGAEKIWVAKPVYVVEKTTEFKRKQL